MRKFFLLLLFTVSIFALGCGKSPLLNHADADVLLRQAETVKTVAKPPLDFPKSGFNASIEWDEVPKKRVYVYLTLRFWNKNTGTAKGPYATPPRKVDVVPWMTSMNHGTAPTEITQIADGVYRVKVFFTMNMEWDMKVQQLEPGNSDPPLIFEEASEPIEVF